MSLKNLSKGRFLQYLTCPLTAWKLRHGEIESIDPEDHASLFRAEQGHIIGDLATTWFDALLAKSDKPKGVNIDKQLAALGIGRDQHDLWLQQSVLLTQQAMRDPKVHAIYEATFQTGPYVTRADILARSRPSWNMIEVKSIGEKREEEYIQDMAYTTGILIACGVPVNKIGLMRIDRDFSLQNTGWLARPRNLLNLLDVSWRWQEEVMGALQHFNTQNLWLMADQVTSYPTPPPPNWSTTCKNCESCQKALLRKDECHSVLDLPNIGHMAAKFQELTDQKIYCLEDVPNGFFNGKGSRERVANVVVESIKRNQVFVGTGLHAALQDVTWPVFYLDFEFLGTAIPLYEGAHPYEMIPFQYSLHRSTSLKSANGLLPDIKTLEHREYLADPAVDGRKELARQFLRDLDELGQPDSSIMVYNRSAEETCIKQLAVLFDEEEPEIAAKLRELPTRIIDLYAILNKPNLYHPAFNGQYKLKTVAKVFLPGLYASLNIASGDVALASYGELAYAYRCPKLSPWEATEEEKNKVLEDLLKYCQLDTYSLASLHYQFVLLSEECTGCFSEVDLEI